MGWFQAAKCRVGLHDWSEWSAKTYDCSATRHCRVCYATGAGRNHAWSEWGYYNEISCYQRRQCADCGETERTAGEIHLLSDWKYVSARSCEERKICQHCGRHQSREVHAWGVWERESPGSDRIIRFCRRCLKPGEIKEPMPIISLPWYCTKETEKYVIDRMQSSAWHTGDVNNLWLPTESYAKGRDIGLEVGFRPSAPRGNCKYFTWSWDSDEREYVVLVWRGQDWARL